MSLTKYATASLEAINFQSGMLFKELTLAFARVREKDPSQYAAELKNVDIPALVEKHTGMRITLEYADTRITNAWVMPPLLDKNHPLIHHLRRFPQASLEGLAMVRAKGGLLKGEVNRATGRVSGDFTLIVSPVTVTRGLLKTDRFTDAELAAVILHELGHLFTYYEFLGSTITTNYVLQSVSRELTGTRELKRKYEVIEEAKNVLQIDIEDPEALVKTQDATVAQTVILRQAMAKQQDNELKSQTYDATAWEMLADQYANRMGAGRDLVTALGKVSRSAFNPSSLSPAVYLLMEVVKFAFFLGMIFGGLTLIPVALLIADSNFSDYDKTEARLLRIRRDLVARLKERDIGKDESERVQADLDAMDAVLKTYQDKRSLLQLLHSSLIPGRRRQYKQLLFQQDLEKLALNDLFVKANKFENLLR